MKELQGEPIDLVPAFGYSASAAQYNACNEIPDFPKAFQMAPATKLTVQNKPFVWLFYHPGWITVLPVDGNRVLTGRMTGCVLAYFTIKGRLHLAHIGTDSNSEERSKVVKAAWAAAVDSNVLTPLRAWKPSRDFSLKKIGKITDGDPFVLGGANGDGRAFSILCMPAPTDTKGAKLDPAVSRTIETVQIANSVEGSHAAEVLFEQAAT